MNWSTVHSKGKGAVDPIKVQQEREGRRGEAVDIPKEAAKPGDVLTLTTAPRKLEWRDGLVDL